MSARITSHRGPTVPCPGSYWLSRRRRCELRKCVVPNLFALVQRNSCYSRTAPRAAIPSSSRKIASASSEIKKTEDAQRNLYNAIENGLPFDEVLEKRAHELKARRKALLIERTGVGREHALPVDRILPSRVEAFSKAVQAKLRDKAFAKRYLQALVDEIVVPEETATIRGSYAALAEAIAEKKKDTSEEVPSFVCLWRARSDSNARPLGS